MRFLEYVIDILVRGKKQWMKMGWSWFVSSEPSIKTILRKVVFFDRFLIFMAYFILM